MEENEICCLCDDFTGRSGRGEDSLYDVNDEGPYCEYCWEKLIHELKE